MKIGDVVTMNTDRGVNEEIRGATFKVLRIDGAKVHGVVLSGPAEGATYTVHRDEISADTAEVQS